MVKIVGFGQTLETKTEKISELSIDELKNEMWSLAKKDSNVLKDIHTIPVFSYGNHARYNSIYREGKKRAINFEIANIYLKSLFLE
ncbi:MAG: hypothetical protein ABIC91_07005 [Nanoarchaeota archaeon]|nr:hypothetical protein [Nanoarchaeota archaeon]MBU1030010.1 hypothetical protein [Nanoarchaeota archaeon]MBU1850196.1 hypothetical protein [Nanoarchaeota archaeon]